MSKNHPHDNIYSILGKLDALKPTQEEKRFALVKEIRESVEAQGSITEGVSSIEAKLQQQFNEAGQRGGFLGEPDLVGIPGPAKGTKPSPKAITKGADREYYKAPGLGGTTVTKWRKKTTEETCNECGMHEGECPHTMQEGEITRKPGVTTHTKTDYPGYPSDDLEQDDDRTGPKAIGGRGRPRKAQTKNPRPIAGAEKKGRGRPASVKSSPVSMPADPFGRVTGSVSKGKKGTVHSMAEAMDLLGQQLGQLNEGRYLEDSNGETLNHILNRFRAEVREFEQGGDLDDNLYDALYDYYCESGEMPYGTQKARTGDPMRWVAERLEAELGDIAYGKDPANAEGHGLEQEAIGDPQPGIPGNVPLDDKMKRLNNPRDYYEEEVTMEDELNELARLAGLHAEGNAFTGKLASTPKGGEFELDGKTFKDTSTSLEEEPNEGNEFSGALAKAKASHANSFEVDGKEYPVKESLEQPAQPEFSLNTSIDSDGRKTVSVNAEGDQAEALLQMLKMAGLGASGKAQELEQEPVSVEVVGGDEGSEEVEEADAPVDQPAEEPANAPEPEYKSMRASTMGPGEGDNGEKAMNPDRPTFKNGDNALSNPPARGKEVLKAVAALESKLAAEYESIKKVSK